MRRRSRPEETRKRCTTSYAHAPTSATPCSETTADTTLCTIVSDHVCPQACANIINLISPDSWVFYHPSSIYPSMLCSHAPTYFFCSTVCQHSYHQRVMDQGRLCLASLFSPRCGCREQPTHRCASRTLQVSHRSPNQNLHQCLVKSLSPYSGLAELLSRVTLVAGIWLTQATSGPTPRKFSPNASLTVPKLLSNVQQWSLRCRILSSLVVWSPPLLSSARLAVRQSVVVPSPEERLSRC